MKEKNNPSLGYYRMLESSEDPLELFELAIKAEKADFDYLGASDHFHPWRDKNTHTVFPWTWLSSVLEKTKNITVGTGVTCPIFRYHPAIIAQAFATMNYMYPERVFLSLGIGESLNEKPLGYPWPSYEERKAQLIEAVSIIRQLWDGDFVDFDGEYYSLNSAKLYTPPKTDTPLYIAGWGPKSGKVAGRFGDGLYTTLPPVENARDVLLPSFEKGAEEEGKNPEKLEKVGQVAISFDEDYEKALNACRPDSAAIEDHFFTGGHNPKEGDKIQENITDEQLEKRHKITTDPDEITSFIEEVFETGFTKILIESHSPDEEKFLKICKEKIIPYFNKY